MVDSELAIVAGTFAPIRWWAVSRPACWACWRIATTTCWWRPSRCSGGAARTRPARSVRFEGGDINLLLPRAGGGGPHRCRSPVERLAGPGVADRAGEGAPAPIVVVVHDARSRRKCSNNAPRHRAAGKRGPDPSVRCLRSRPDAGRRRCADRPPLRSSVHMGTDLCYSRPACLPVRAGARAAPSQGSPRRCALCRVADRGATHGPGAIGASLASMSRRVLHPRSDDFEAWREVALTVARILDGAQGSGAAASARAGFAPAFDGAGEALKRSDWDKGVVR